MTRQFLLVLWAGLFACTTCLAQNQQPLRFDFDPAHQRPVVLTAPDLKVEVLAQPPDPTTGQTRSIKIKTREGAFIIPLPVDFAQVNEITLGPSGRLVVVGNLAGSVNEVGIVDLTGRKVIDHFSCYQPAVSPNGYYVVFTKWFPPHYPQSVDYHSMLYLVGRSPSENRPAGIEVDNGIDVGFAVNPPGVANWTDDNMDVPSDMAHINPGYYLWVGSTQYFFIDKTQSGVSVAQVMVSNSAATVREIKLPSDFLGAAKGYFLPSLLNAAVDGDTLSLNIFMGKAQPASLKLSDFVTIGSVDLSQRPAGGGRRAGSH